MITLAEAKLHLRLITDLTDADSYTAEDAHIQGLISAAYRHAEAVTRTTLERRSKTLVLDGFPAGSQAIELPWTPVEAVESLEYVDPDGIEQSLAAETLRLDTRPIYPRLAPQWGSLWPATTDEPECVSITATAGAAELPADIRAALLLLVGHFYENREAVVIGTISSAIPFSVETLLAPYVIHSVG
ncbi:head-tail connector protein [Halomonas lysinitropha]|uniref:Phage gp6-like head-tail connector protein n=1 Tax=Halomonas lysinitropha TaxID=2607506 RepID=A0A5K1I529_9GAMM|nr:head-tail connector protein [Halomonas lysinitropha]VVZ96505.1 Phage gp6-like head-tail connector protein [Halomonas lysinitropha]